MLLANRLKGFGTKTFNRTKLAVKVFIFTPPIYVLQHIYRFLTWKGVGKVPEGSRSGRQGCRPPKGRRASAAGSRSSMKNARLRVGPRIFLWGMGLADYFGGFAVGYLDVYAGSEVGGVDAHAVEVVVCGLAGSGGVKGVDYG